MRFMWDLNEFKPTTLFSYLYNMFWNKDFVVVVAWQEYSS